MANKLKNCKVCGAEIAENAKTCPKCGAKNSKPIYKKWWFWVILVILVLAAAGGSGSDEETPAVAGSTPTSSVADTGTTGESKLPESAPVSKAKPEEEKVPTEYKNALKKAESYSEMMNMSKKGIYDQLVSEYGENFPEEAAQYAIDNLDADWNANALAKAKTYQESMAMSNAAIYDQLVSEYGEQFTEEEAQYAVDHLG